MNATEKNAMIADLVAGIEQSKDEAQKLAQLFANEDPVNGQTYILCFANDFTPFRTDGSVIALVGKRIWCGKWKQATKVAADLTQKGKQAGSQHEVIAMTIRSWLYEYTTQLNKLLDTLNANRA